MDRRRIVVVGGGITGAFAAYFLAREGRGVTLVERAGIGSQASGFNPGGLNPMHGCGIPGVMEPFALVAFQLHLDHWATIAQLSRIDFSPSRPARIHVALGAGDVPALERAHALHCRAEGFSARWLEPAELRALDSRISTSATHALWTSGNAKVNARAYTQAVAAAATQLGVRIESASVVGLDHVGGRVSAVVLDSGTLRCDGVIFATGPWVSDVEKWTGCAIPMAPIKGELLLARTAGELVRHSFAWDAASVYGHGTMDVWLGGNEERAGFDCTPTPTARDLILERVGRLMPGLRIAKVIDHTAALRPVTPDDFPIVGCLPQFDNVCLALGGGRKGMLYSTALGLAAADLVTRGTTSVPIAHCSPARF